MGADAGKTQCTWLVQPGVEMLVDARVKQITDRTEPATAVGLAGGTVRDVVPLGFEDHSLPENALDPGNEDGGVNLGNYPVLGIYQPDAVAAFSAGGEPYIFSANEGDGRAWEGFRSVGDDEYVLDPARFPDAATLKDEARLGALTVTDATGDNDGDFDDICAFGGRSVSVRGAEGGLVYDSGSLLEQRTAARYPEFLNATNDRNGSGTFDNRSDNKGPEPVGIVLGRAFGRLYAFVGLERIGGVVSFDLSRLRAPVGVDYTSPRDFTADSDGRATSGRRAWRSSPPLTARPASRCSSSRTKSAGRRAASGLCRATHARGRVSSACENLSGEKRGRKRLAFCAVMTP